MVEATKNEKQLVNEYCQREKLANPLYVCTPDNTSTAQGFFCTLTVNGQTFCTANWEKTKKSAELEAAKLAVKKLNITAVKSERKPKVDKADSSTNSNQDVKPAIPEKDPSWITIEKVEDIYEYLTDEVLAQEFKSFLHCKAQEEKKPYPVFTVEEVANKGFTAKVTYDSNVYNSLGLMLTKKQAEQSAAEVCLRTLGDFPEVPTEKYTIQVYKGGKANLTPRKVKTNSS